MKYEEIENRVRSTKNEKTKGKNPSGPQPSRQGRGSPEAADFRLQRGVAIYLGVIIMTILLALALGISSILIGQLKISRQIENSVVAIYAADTGIEHMLYEEKLCRKPDCPLYCQGSPPDICLGLPDDYYFPPSDPLQGTLNNGSTYEVIREIVGDEIKFKSIGEYKGVKRAIETSMPVPLPPELTAFRFCELTLGLTRSCMTFGTQWSMGYKFTPQYNFEVKKLCGYFNATRDVVLYADGPPLTEMARALVEGNGDTISGSWVCTDLSEPPIITGGSLYYVVAEIINPPSNHWCGSFIGAGVNFLPITPPLDCPPVSDLIQIGESILSNVVPFDGTYDEYADIMYGLVDIVFEPTL